MGDQFGLAATLVAMLDGRGAGDARTRVGAVGLPARLTEVISRALAPTVTDRFPSVTAFARNLREALDTACGDVEAGVWEALERRDVGMARVLVETARRLRPGHPDTEMLVAHVARQVAAIGDPASMAALAGVGPLPAIGSTDPGLGILAGKAASARPVSGRGGNPWVVLVLGAVPGMESLIVAALVAFSFS